MTTAGVAVCPQADPRGEGQRDETPPADPDREHRRQQPQYGQLQAHSGESRPTGLS